MKKSKQAGKYILSDFISASVAWLLFNILRYEVFAIDEGADSLLDYLQYPGVLGGQVVIPLFWLVLYFFSDFGCLWLLNRCFLRYEAYFALVL